MYPTTAQSHLQLQHSHQGAASLGVQQPSYQYHHPTPPYYSQTEIFQGYSNGPSPPAQQPQQQVLQSQQKYLATPSNSFPQPSLPSTSCPPLATQQQLQQQQLQYQFPEQKQAAVPLAINTKMVTQSNNGPNSAPMSSPSNRKQQQQSISQLAEFAAHIVCYLLYGHQSPRRQSQSRCAGTPPSSIPSSPLPGHNSSTCHCEVCNRAPYSPARSTPVYPQGRPTHRRMVSESDIVQPKPMFRKFCLDVLSATLLSPSVILLSLKYIQQLMINLKESNKIVNTGDGAEYRFFTGALILANKFLDDNTFTNKTWADITGMKIKDVNHLEMQFLNGIDFRLFTSSHHYSEWLASLTQFTSVHMPSQHQVAYQQQAAAAQSPVSPMDHTNSFTESVSARQHGSGSESRHSAQSLSMASISQYIDSVKHLQQKSTSSSRYQRVPSTAYNQTPASSTAHSSQQQFMSLPPPSQGPHSIQQVQSNLSPSTHPHAYQQETQEPARRKRSAVNAFDDSMERSPCYDLGSLPYSNHVPIRRQSHKRFSSSSSLATLMGISTGQDVFQSNGPSPSVQQQRHYQRSHRASSGSLSTPFRGQHQRSVSGSYYIDMTGYASNYGQESSQINLPMPNTFSRSGGIHPLERDQELGHRPPSRTDAYHAPLSMHHGSMATGGRSQAYRPSTPPQYSPNKCETTCHSSGCGSNVSTGPAASYDVDPRLWGPLDSLSLYAITTQAAKRVVAQSKALSSSANGLHMYYPTTLA